MKEIIDEITIHWVKNIYKEPQFSASNLDKLSTEYKLEVNVLNPLWSDSSSSWYIENYKNNLKVLEKIYE
jgi:ABC-type Zn uptake system ZnuABC Zn-binding protein ZnuA